MKLAFAELSNVVLSDKNQVTEWIIESPDLFARYVQELICQCEGKDGDFVLSKNDKIVEISKYMEVIINPFGIDINNKKIYYNFLNMPEEDTQGILTDKCLLADALSGPKTTDGRIHDRKWFEGFVPVEDGGNLPDGQ